MTGTLPSLGAILRINCHFFMAVMCALIAWLIWPETLEGWGWGFLAVILGASSLVSVIQALREMTQLYLRDKAVAALIAQSKTAKSDQFASMEDLQKRGLIDE